MVLPELSSLLATTSVLGNQVSLLSVDGMHQNLPPMERDMYWNEAAPQPPYTAASARSRRHSFMGSTFNISLKKEDLELWSKEEADTDKKESGYSSTIGCFLGLQPKNYHLPLKDLKTKLLCSKNPLLEGQCKDANQKNQKDVWKFKGLDFLKCVPRFKRRGSHCGPQAPSSHPTEQSAPSSSDTGDGPSTDYQEICHMKKKTVEFNLNIPESPTEHLQQRRLDQMSTNIQALMKEHAESYPYRDEAGTKPVLYE